MDDPEKENVTEEWRPKAVRGSHNKPYSPLVLLVTYTLEGPLLTMPRQELLG